MKRNYETLSMEVLQVDCGQTILAGSRLKTKVDVNEVEVAPFMKDGDFVDSGNDFKSISFD